MFRVKKKKKTTSFQISLRRSHLFTQKKKKKKTKKKKKKKHTLITPTVPNQRDIPGEPGERNPAFVADFGHYSSCASKKQNCGKKRRK